MQGHYQIIIQKSQENRHNTLMENDCRQMERRRQSN